VFCTTREEAEAVISKADVPELETASNVLRLTAEVVTLITANRSVTVADAITEWNSWLKVTARSKRTRTNNVIAVRQFYRAAFVLIRQHSQTAVHSRLGANAETRHGAHENEPPGRQRESSARPRTRVNPEPQVGVHEPLTAWNIDNHRR
jgi:hypothetical protein